DDATLGIEGPHDIRQVRHQTPVLFVALAEGCFRDLARRDVYPNAENARLSVENDPHPRQIARNPAAPLVSHAASVSAYPALITRSKRAGTRLRYSSASVLVLRTAANSLAE